MLKDEIPCFRFNNKRKHPSYILDEEDEEYYNVLITHSEKDKKRKNVQLYKNPDSEDDKTAYIHNEIYKDNKKSFGKIFKRWKLHYYDKRKIDDIKKKRNK